MFERILVPLDGGPRGDLALSAAERLAHLWSARLDVLGLAETGDTLSKVESAIERQTADVKGGASVSVRSAVYTVGDEIKNAIESTSSTLVVMATAARGRSAALLGSVAEEVLRSISGPALLIGPETNVPADWPTGPMFVCTDGSVYSEEIIPHAATFAGGLELAPWVISVNEPVQIPATVPDGMETNYTSRVAAQLEPLVDTEVNFDVLHGTHAAKDITDYARSRDAGLIALATHGRTGLQRLTAGSVAMEVVHNASCPVLVARPQDGERSG